MTIFNIVSLILFFTSVLPIVNFINGKEVTAYTVRKFVKYVQQMLFSLVKAFERTIASKLSAFDSKTTRLSLRLHTSLSLIESKYQPPCISDPCHFNLRKLGLEKKKEKLFKNLSDKKS